MGSKEDAIIEESERFQKYLDDEDIEYIANGKTQGERIRRLKARFEKVFSESGEKGERFIYGGGTAKDYDMRHNEEYAEALEAIYDNLDFQTRLQRFAEPIMRERTERRKLITLPRGKIKIPAVEDLPKKILVEVHTYKKKDGSEIAGHVRRTPTDWTPRKSKWLWNRRHIHDNAQITTDFIEKFNEQTTKKSISMKKWRLNKQKT